MIRGILAGICISLGGAVYLSTDSTLAGAVLFTLGLFTICIRDYALYTGKVSYALDNHLSYLPELLVIWLGNLLGTFVAALCYLQTRMAPGIEEKARALCETKLSDSYLSLFILGIFCNVLIYTAVDGFKKNPHETGKYLGLFLGVIVFILCGFEHCVADMFYFSVGGWSARGFVLVLIVTLGNSVGGLLFPALDKIVIYLKKEEK